MREKDRLKADGFLALHGITKAVVLDVDGLSAASKDPWGNLRRGASATTGSAARISGWPGMGLLRPVASPSLMTC